MKLFKLNTVVISALALLGVEALGVEAAQAKSKPAADTTMLGVPAVAYSASAPSLVKRGVLLSVGNVNLSTGDVRSNLASAGYANAVVKDTSDNLTFAIGYRQPIGRYWSVDATYIDQGDVSAKVTADPSGANPAKDVNLALPIYGRGLSYAGLRHFPVINGVTAHVGAGAFIYTSERKSTVAGITHTKEHSGVSAMAQLGLSFSVTPRVTVEVTGQRFFNNENVDRLSVGISVGF